jgi:hypothetical protein
MEYQIYEVRIYENGTLEWRQNGKLNRVGGPAVEGYDGYQAWYKNDVHHRLDGPAVIYADGTQAWYIDGKQYTKRQFEIETGTYSGSVFEFKGKKYLLEELKECS